jgi:hypothetical protein
VINTAAQKGFENRPEFKVIKNMLEHYWNADTDEKRDEKATDLVNQAKRIRASWERIMDKMTLPKEKKLEMKRQRR